LNLYDLKKYLGYALETRSFAPDFAPDKVSAPALEAARAIRGADRAPAIIIHGIMPRSGTVYVGELLRLHPDLYAYPYQLWEIPFLQLTGDMLKLQAKFFLAYEQNVGRIGEHDFLPLFGAALIAFLHTQVPQQQRLLIKVPSVQYLSYFSAMFPHESLLVLVRDGRDLVQSTIRTWPQLRFSQVCWRWNRAARMVLSVHQHMSKTNSTGYWLARYKDALDDPDSFVEEACRRFGLDESRYPYEQIETIPVRGSSALARQTPVSWDPVERPQDFRPVGYWEEWSAIRKWIFKRIAGQSLIDLGYCEDRHW